MSAARAFLNIVTGKIELLRVNDKYARELGGSISIEEALALDFANHMDGRNLSMMYENIEAAIASGAESTCELCLSGLSGEKHIPISA